MARERYLINGGDETIHKDQVVLAKNSDKAKNWWYYNKFILLGIVLLVAIVGSFVYSMVTKVNPDYTIGLMTSYSMPTDAIDKLQNHIANYGEDLNDDAVVTVSITNYVMAPPDGTNTVDPTLLEASIVKFMADAGSNEMFIYMHDKPSFNHMKHQLGGYFTYLDGTPMPETATDFENVMLPWGEAIGLKDFDSSFTESEKLSAADFDEIFGKLRISFKANLRDTDKNDKNKRIYEGAKELYSNLVSGTVAD